MLEINTYKLEPTAAEIRQMLDITTDKIITYLQNIDQAVIFDMEEARAQAFQQSTTMPEMETSLQDILNDLFDNKIPFALPTTHPGFMAYIPGGGIFHAALADLIAKVTNRYIGIDATAPFLNQIEADVLKWFCEMIGFPNTAGGTLTSGGSIANLTAVICARTLVMGENFSKGTVYASDFVHHSMWKAFHAAGIGTTKIRNIPVDGKYKLDVKALEKAITTDINNGFTPLMVVASAGSTNTGSIDPLVAISKVCNKYNAWYHIDAAYGGFFALTDSGKERLKGIEFADSITLDPHKGLFLPYGTGAFIVRDREKLKTVFSHKADYIPDKTSNHELWDFSEMSLELTRPFRGLGVWLPFKMLGAGSFRDALQEKLQLASYFHQKISQSNRWEIIAAPELSLTVFRYNNPRLNVAELNAVNKKIINHVNNKNRAIVSGTIINGNFVIRSCILSFRTHEIHLDRLIEDLNQALDFAIDQ